MKTTEITETTGQHGETEQRRFTESDKSMGLIRFRGHERATANLRLRHAVRVVHCAQHEPSRRLLDNAVAESFFSTLKSELTTPYWFDATHGPGRIAFEAVAART